MNRIEKLWDEIYPEHTQISSKVLYEIKQNELRNAKIFQKHNQTNKEKQLPSTMKTALITIEMESTSIMTDLMTMLMTTIMTKVVKLIITQTVKIMKTIKWQ